MRKYRLFIAGAIVVSALALSLGSLAVVEGSGDNGIDVQSVGPLQYTFSETYQTPDIEIEPMANGTADVYNFIAQDLNTNATILFLTNTSNKLADVVLIKYNLIGNTIIFDGVTLGIGPANMAIICSDEVTSTVGMWKYAAHWDMGSTVMYVELVLPPGVVADGYVAWNGSDNEYNPGSHSDNAATVPLQFNYVGSVSIGQ